MMNISTINSNIASPGTFCDKVSLRKLVSIQSYGVVFILDKIKLHISQVSGNVLELLNWPAEILLNQSFTSLIVANQYASFQMALSQSLARVTLLPLELSFHQHSQTCWLRIQSYPDYYIVECEPQSTKIDFASMAYWFEDCLQSLKQAHNTKSVCQNAARVFKYITGYDKIMVYQFDKEWCGHVVAEEKVAAMESYLGLKFPATDIPKQVRDYYHVCQYRYIPNIHYKPISLTPALNPATEQVPDLTYCHLRAVAPVHIEYLTNMHLQSATSFALLQEDNLWGIITCHHRTPKPLLPEQRITLNLLAQYMAQKLMLVQNKAQHERKTRAFMLQTNIAERMFNAEQTGRDFKDCLVEQPETLLEMVAATGAAIYLNKQLQTIGKVPKNEDIEQIIDWLKQQPEQEVFPTDTLPKLFPASVSYEQVACGLIGLVIAKEKSDYILFFRPAMVYKVQWAGNPKESLQFESPTRYHPRHSFKLWEETVHHRALPWQDYEIEAAKHFRHVVIDRTLQRLLQQQTILLEDKVKERTLDLENSNAELEQFAYISSHQLKEPLRMISSFSQILNNRYHHQLDSEGQEFMGYVTDGALRMQQLIDNVLALSQIGKQTKAFKLVACEDILKSTLNNLKDYIEENAAVITFDTLPHVMADYILLSQLFQNLLSNAIKFRKNHEGVHIHVGVVEQAGMWLFSIKDNGIGIESQYFERIFKLFNRLHGVDSYPGTGIGLTICKKIVEHHRGTIWLESTFGQGSTFYFTLPKLQN